MPVPYIMLSQLVVVRGPDTEESYSEIGNTIGRTIHPDDTVHQTKLKLVEFLRCSPDEMVLFGSRSEVFSIDALYQDLSQNSTIPISRPRLFAALGNFSPIDLSDLPNKDEYSYEDLLGIRAPREVNVSFLIGVRYALTERYPVCSNPFGVVDVDMTLVNDVRKIASTQEAQVMMHYPTNILYVATAADVSAFEASVAFPSGSLLSIYFPHLLAGGPIDRNVLAVDSSVRLDAALIESEALEASWNVVDMLYDLGSEKPEINRMDAGITEISFVHHPIANARIPVDIVFKILTTSNERPLTKYNAGSRMEKLFRLFAPAVAQNGKRIPAIKKSHAARLARILARDKGVGVFLRDEGKQLTLEFSTEGSVRITSKHDSPVPLRNLVETIAPAINDVYNDINDYTSQSGYQYTLFEGFSSNVEIIDVQYKESFQLPERCDLLKMKECVRHVFSIEDSSTPGTTLLTGVRVGYYNKMNAIEAFITRAIKRGVIPDMVVRDLESTFGITRDQGAEHVAQWLRNVEVEQNAYRGKRITVQSSAGITIALSEDMFTSNLIMTAKDINEIGAIPVLSQLVSGFLRMSCRGLKTKYDAGTIASLCKAASNRVINEPVFGQAKLKPFLEGNERGTVATVNELVFDDDRSEGDDLLDELFGDMGSDEEGEEVLSDNDAFLDGIADDDDSNEPTILPKADKTAVDDESRSIEPSDGRDEQRLTREAIVGMSLTNPNYFFDRMFRRDPDLFLKKGDGRYSAYSRLCPHNLRRQPVVLSDAEKERIEAENPGAIDFSKAVRYGSADDGSNANWYVCPRYWCLLTNSPLTKEQVDAGECGGKIIPFDAKTVPDGHYIFEFNAGRRNNEHIDAKGNYIEHFPGFLDADRHPDGKCIPCCFKGPWEKATLARRREQCLADGDGPPQQKRTAAKEPAKFPLRAGERGFLPSAIEAVLSTRNISCQVSSKNRTLRADHPCFLRAGVEKTDSSFLAAIGAAHTPSLTVSETRAKLADVCTVEIFPTLQNGSLIGAFLPEDNLVFAASPDGVRRRIAAAHNHFLEFLRSSNTPVDYTYIWDLVSDHFFDKPINIILLDVKDDDGTDNVQLICPTNHYKTYNYSQKVPSLLVMKKESYFEPIFVFTETSRAKGKDRKVITKVIDTSDAKLPLPERTAIQKLGKLLQNCGSEEMYNRAYIFKAGANIETTIAALENAGLSVKQQVLNYDGKTVGVTVSERDIMRFVPTAPSNTVLSLDKTHIDNRAIWHGYTQTTQFLSNIAKKTGLPVSPKVKVRQSGLVVGILTEADQFVQLSVPAEDVVADGLLVREAESDADVDAVVFSTESGDVERNSVMKKLRLEREYFAAFRNTLKHLLAKPKNLAIVRRLNSLVESPETYLAKLDQTRALLERTGASAISFAGIADDILSSVDSVSTCIENPRCDQVSNCLSTAGECMLIVPDKHLITGNNNKSVYYGRVADEIVRYPRVRDYLLGYDSYLQLGKDSYDLGEDEIIILGDLLFGEYYSTLIPRAASALVAAPTYDDVIAAQAVTTTEVVDLREGKTDVACASVKKPIGSKEVWFSMLPDPTYVQRFAPVAPCGFDLLSVIASVISSSIVTRQDIRKLLGNIYSSLIPTQQAGIIATLRQQGKKDLMARYVSGQVGFPDMIFSEDYWITNLDIRLVAQKLNLPVIIISGNKVIDNKQRALTTTPAESALRVVFIKQHGIKNDAPQPYSLLYHGAELLFSKEQLPVPTLALINKTVGTPLLVRPTGKRRLLVVE